MTPSTDAPRGRPRTYGLAPGIFPPGPQNAITDVGEVAVGHASLIRGEDVRTGVTVILPHGDNLHRWRAPAGFDRGNGFGKFFGAMQVLELGEIETPIALTNTLSVPEVAAGLIDWTLAQDGNEAVRSVNAVVGETNDSLVNDIRLRAVRPSDVLRAIADARRDGDIEGCVGAGVGAQLFGWKGGIGTSSRVLPPRFGGYRVGVLIQTNYGGTPIIGGAPIAERLDWHAPSDPFFGLQGSVILIVATDAPILSRDLTRMAKRTFLGLSRTGSSMAHGSGEFAIAFSTNPAVWRDRDADRTLLSAVAFSDAVLSALFQAVVEASEEAAYNALFAAVTVSSGIGVLHRLPDSIFASILERNASASPLRAP